MTTSPGRARMPPSDRRYGPLCRHCSRPKVRRGRKGLCERCYHWPGVPGMYPSLSAFDSSKHSHENNRRTRPLPLEPTACRPGSAGKIDVMEGRRTRGEQLHHPDDAEG